MSTIEAGRTAASGKPDSTSRDGLSLQAVIEAPRRLDELSCARVVGAAAEAVHAAQKGGQPIGTVTPAAILLLPDGGVKLVAGPVSLRYSAPEKLRGGGGDRRTDVFALGVVLWEALVHDKLFDGASDDAIKQAVLGDAIRLPSELNANVPAELDAICKRALARDPAERYPSARVMAAEIDAVLGDAGYPESNDAIAAYVARALAPAPPRTGEPDEPTTKVPSLRGALPSILAASPAAPAPPAPSPAAPAPSPAAPAPSPAPSPALTETAPGMPGGLRPPASPASQPDEPTEVGLVRPAVKPTLSPPERRAPPSNTLPMPSATPRPLAQTAILGSGISSTEPMPALTPTSEPAATPAFAVPQSHPIVVEPAAPKQGHAAAETQLGLGPLPRPLHPLPPVKPSIANAETLPTPQLPSHMAPQASSQAAPSSPPQDPHADPADVVALPDKASGPKDNRDVLAGWGWTTGSMQTIDDNDSAAVHAALGDRRRLLYAIGGALGVAILIAILAFAFSGSKPGEQGAQADAKRSTTAPSATAPSATAPSATAPSAPAAPLAPGDPAASPTGTAPAASSEPAAPPASTPPASAPGEPAAPPTSAPPSTASPQPSSTASSAPPPTSAPKSATTPASRAELVDEKPGLAAPEPPRPEPTKPEPTKPEPTKPEPTKVAASHPEPARPDPTKLEPRPEVKKLEKKPEPKKPPERPLRRPLPAVKATPRAQPIDPYAMPDKPKADPAEAYKTGLQQYARGDTTGALATFRSSLAGSPRYAPTWRGLGLVFEKLGDKGQARSAFRRYLQLAPTAADADQIRDRMERLGS